MTTDVATEPERKTFKELVMTPGRNIEAEKVDKYREYMLERLEEAKTIMQKAVPEVFKDLPVQLNLSFGDRSYGFASRMPREGKYQITISRPVSERGNPDNLGYADELVSSGWGGKEVFPRRVVDTVRLMHELSHALFAEAVPLDSIPDNYFHTVDAAVNEGFAQYLGVAGVRYMQKHAGELELTDQEVEYLHFNVDRRREGIVTHELADFYVDGAFLVEKVVKWGGDAVHKVWQRLDGKKMAATTGSKELFTRLRDPEQLLKEFGKPVNAGVEIGGER